MKQESFICECENPKHLIIFSYSDDEISNDVYMTVHINPCYGFWKRLVHAMRYLFGHKSKYGDFDTFIFKSEDADRLQKIVDYMNKAKDKGEEL